MTLEITGYDLSIEDIVNVARHGQKVSLNADVVEKCLKKRRLCMVSISV